MADVSNIAGHTFGAWTVLDRAPTPPGNRTPGQFWRCVCQCGGEEILNGARMRAGRFSRGCSNCRGVGHARRGKSLPAYQSWRGMRERCTNPNHASFALYGGRGISVCARWLNSFDAFLADMGERPRGTSIDRINSNGDYEPGNCRWADAKTQARNSEHFRLTDDQVAAVRRLLASGARQIDVAQAVGVTRSHIANIAIGNARMMEEEMGA